MDRPKPRCSHAKRNEAMTQPKPKRCAEAEVVAQTLIALGDHLRAAQWDPRYRRACENAARLLTALPPKCKTCNDTGRFTSAMDLDVRCSCS